MVHVVASYGGSVPPLLPSSSSGGRSQVGYQCGSPGWSSRALGAKGGSGGLGTSAEFTGWSTQVSNEKRGP